MKALRTALRTCKNYKVRINAAMALGAPQQRSDLGVDTALAEVAQDLIEAAAHVPSWVELTDLKYNDALNVQVHNYTDVCFLNCTKIISLNVSQFRYFQLSCICCA